MSVDSANCQVFAMWHHILPGNQQNIFAWHDGEMSLCNNLEPLITAIASLAQYSNTSVKMFTASSDRC